MYTSTRSPLEYSDTSAVLTGIAPDGGLFVDPDVRSRAFDVSACMGLEYTAVSEKVMSHLLPGFESRMHEIVSVYPGKFSSPEITPLVKIGDDFCLELYYGPTLAFKDVALSVLPLFITAAKDVEGISETISILTATSGDTGKAALEGFHDVPGTDITVFFPHGGVSAMQRLQMVTQSGANVRVAAVEGNFDDCQRGVKEAFARFASLDEKQRGGRILSSANSINIGRLVPQVAYYFSAYSQLVSRGEIAFGEDVDFIVPTGNFGDILAGYLAKCMGLPVGRLVCASNSNSVLYDFLTTGVYDRRRPFLKTASPSMDILVSSNLERLLFYASEGDFELVSSLMAQLSSEGVYALSGTHFAAIQSLFSAGWCSEAETAETIGRMWRDFGYLCDTHTAVALAVMEKYKSSEGRGRKCVALSTASPFKFPSAVLSAIGGTPSDDEFETAMRLSELTGVPCPEAISGLKTKPVLHSGVIGIDEVVPFSLTAF